MIRITNNSNGGSFGQGAGLAKVKAVLANKYFRIGLAVAVLAGSYFIWTHGRLTPGQWNKDVLRAQASSPLPPEWLQRYFGKSYCLRINYCGPDADPDRDGMTNYEEFLYFTDPTNPDTDKDGVSDGQELKNLTNPLGAGPATTPRDINSLGQYNPFADQLTQEGLSAIQSGELTTIDQIAAAAERLTNLPNFNDVPFNITDKNDQNNVYEYLAKVAKYADEYRATPVVAEVGVSVLDTTDAGKLQQYIEATDTYSAKLVYTAVPSDVLAFHKALFGSLVLTSLIANTQKLQLDGTLIEADAHDRTRILTIYYTRFVQDMDAASQKLREKYDFPFNQEVNKK